MVLSFVATAIIKPEPSLVMMSSSAPPPGANNVLPGVHGERNVAGIAGVPVQFTLDIDEVRPSPHTTRQRAAPDSINKCCFVVAR